MRNSILAIFAVFALALSGCSYLEKSSAPAETTVNPECCAAAAKAECEAAKAECAAAKAECAAAAKQCSAAAKVEQ
ncbi:MAG TPA: hypothetical protein EYN79_01085 [Planctomycetes bacterium]|nr:hypothetical protein [Planctomycetota bacterium]HIN80330.1 hypothetical protein [Planctomycetota bacterium]